MKFNLNNSYRVVLKKKLAGRNGKLIQYIEAGCTDEAIKRAMNTFEARLYTMDEGIITKETQKADINSPVYDSLRFGFKGGWFTVHGKGISSNIYEMLKQAEDSDFFSDDVEEIHAMYVNGKRR